LAFGKVILFIILAVAVVIGVSSFGAITILRQPQFITQTLTEVRTQEVTKTVQITTTLLSPTTVTQAASSTSTAQILLPTQTVAVAESLVLSGYDARNLPLVFRIKNTGQAEVRINQAYIGGSPVGIAQLTIAPGQEGVLTVLPSQNLLQGVSYILKVVTANGNQFTFTFISGSSA